MVKLCLVRLCGVLIWSVASGAAYFIGDDSFFMYDDHHHHPPMEIDHEYSHFDEYIPMEHYHSVPHYVHSEPIPIRRSIRRYIEPPRRHVHYVPHPPIYRPKYIPRPVTYSIPRIKIQRPKITYIPVPQPPPQPTYEYWIITKPDRPRRRCVKKGKKKNRCGQQHAHVIRKIQRPRMQSMRMQARLVPAAVQEFPAVQAIPAVHEFPTVQAIPAVQEFPIFDDDSSDFLEAPPFDFLSQLGLT